MVFILLVRVGPPEPATHQPFPTRHPSERRDLNRMHTTVATEIRWQARDDRLPRRPAPVLGERRDLNASVGRVRPRSTATPNR